MKRNALILFIVGTVAVLLGVAAGIWGAPVIWLGCDFLILSIAHLARSEGVFGKRSNGTLPGWSWILFLPYFVYSYLVWHAIRLLHRESPFNEISQNLIVGRRLLDAETLVDVANYVDLTTEFQESKRARNLSGYLCFAILDAGAPDPKRLHDAIATLKPGKTYVHCAQGHGRTGIFAIATLLASGNVKSIEEGLNVVQTARPGVRLNNEQRMCVERFMQVLSKTRGVA